MNRPDPERVWLGLFGCAIKGLSGVVDGNGDMMTDDELLAKQAARIADAALDEWQRRYPAGTRGEA